VLGVDLRPYNVRNNLAARGHRTSGHRELVVSRLQLLEVGGFHVQVTMFLGLRGHGDHKVCILGIGGETPRPFENDKHLFGGRRRRGRWVLFGLGTANQKSDRQSSGSECERRAWEIASVRHGVLSWKKF